MTQQSKTQIYAENYQILEEISERLQNGQSNPNIIDELASLIAQATKSYQLCSERIKSAEKVLEKHEQLSDKN